MTGAPEDATPHVAEFLLARIAEEEEQARAAGGEWWHAAEMPPPGMRRRGDEKTHWIVDSPATLVSYEVTQADMAEHIAAWSPARVLAECDAKRRIVELHRLVPVDLTGACCMTCLSDDDGNQYVPGACDTARLLALPYAGHRDYDPAWRP